MEHPNPILLFDGVCNLCNGLVMFIIRKDNKARIKFASLQSVAGQSLLSESGLNRESIDTVVYLTDGKFKLRSSAVLSLLKDMGRGWQLFYVFIIIPGFLRDFFYNLIAKKRYRIFGRTDRCMVPSPDVLERFIM